MGPGVRSSVDGVWNGGRDVVDGGHSDAEGLEEVYRLTFVENVNVGLSDQIHPMPETGK